MILRRWQHCLFAAQQSDNLRGKDGKFPPLIGRRMDPEVAKESGDSKEVAETPAEVAEPMETDGEVQQVRGGRKCKAQP